MSFWTWAFQAMVWFLRHGIPAIMIIVGLATALQRVLMMRRLKWVKGTVIDHLESSDSDGKVYRAKIAFQAGDREMQVLDEMSFGWKAQPVGHLLWIGYREDEPDKAIVWRIWPVLMSLLVAGAGAAVLMLQ